MQASMQVGPPVAGDIGHEEILRRIPHRYPFLLVDRAEQWVRNQSIVGIKHVGFNEAFFKTTAAPTVSMPGILLVDALGQTGALLMSKSFDVDMDSKTTVMITIDRAQMPATVHPGDLVRMPVCVVSHKGMVVRFHGEAYVGDTLVCEADFAAIVVDGADEAIV